MSDTADVLLVGAGDLGTEIGLRLAREGCRVAAMRRRPELVTAPMISVEADVRAELPPAATVPKFSGRHGGPRLLVICLTAGGRDVDAYRSIFLEGVGRLLDDVSVRGWAPERAVFVSSTGVCSPHGNVDENTPPEPQAATAQVLLEAENQFLRKLPPQTQGVIVRPSGLYGPGREWFINQVRSGTIHNTGRMTHRIHRDDAASAVAHLLTMRQTPEQLYLLTDDTPVVAEDVAAFIAGELGIAWPPMPDSHQESGHSRPLAKEHKTPVTPSLPAHSDAQPPPRILTNTRLKSTGFRFDYPSYREGYRAIIRQEGKRHP